LNYFDEQSNENCGICSNCISENYKEIGTEDLRNQILTLLKIKALNSREIQIHINKSSDAIIFALQNLLENGEIIISPNNRYTLK
jgi:ATP-dependent DNA helicase RecQ